MKKFTVYSLQFITALATTVANASTLVVESLHANEIRTREISYARPSTKETALYFPFEADTGAAVLDASGNGYNGTATQCVWTNEGQFAGGAMFWPPTSSGAGIVVTNAPDFPMWSAYTVSVWFKYEPGRSQAGYVLCRKCSNVAGFEITVQYQYLMCTYDNINYAKMQTGPAQIYDDGAWHHLAVVRNGTDGQLWVDGDMKASVNTLFSMSTEGAPLCIGNDSRGPLSPENWNGLIDEFRVYGCALSPDEIELLHASGRLLKPSTDTVTVSAPLSVSGDMTVHGSAAFLGGIRYVAPLGDLSSGSYTNSVP